MWGVLPVKNFENAKTRLSPALSPDERRGLFAAMVEDVLTAMVGARGLDGVLVLSNEPEAAALARRLGARIESEPANVSQTSAVTTAAMLLKSEGVEGVLTLPGDIPLVRAAEIDAALAVHARSARPAVTIVPAWDRRGSNCMMVSPPDAIPFSFGNDSFGPHQDSARRLGATLTIVGDLPGIALDVDNPSDLAMLLAEPQERLAGTRAHAFLVESGIATRFAKAS